MTQPITEAKSTTSRLATIQKLLAKAEAEGVTDQERDLLTEKAAELMARYGVDQAMLAQAGKEIDPVVDKVIWTSRPFAGRMADLLGGIAQTMGAEARTVKQFDENAHGGQRKGAWKYGLRLFIHASDLQRVEMMYAAARNQALAGASKIKGYDDFGQDQKAHRDSYLEGFGHAVVGRVYRAEAAARQAAEAEREALAEEALLRGELTSGPSVALVLNDRRSVVKAAADLALYKITPAMRIEMEAKKVANREKWADQDRESQKRHAARIAEHEACERCRKAASGFCNGHRDLKPSQASYRGYERVGNYYHDGYSDGQRADLGTSGKAVSNRKQGELS
jgi:hypothetical protein